MNDLLNKVSALRINSLPPDLLVLQQKVAERRRRNRRRRYVSIAAAAGCTLFGVAFLASTTSADRPVVSVEPAPGTSDVSGVSDESIPADRQDSTERVTLVSKTSDHTISVPAKLDGYEATTPGGSSADLIMFRETGNVEDMPLGYVSIHVGTDDAAPLAQEIRDANMAGVMELLDYAAGQVSAERVDGTAVIAVTPSTVISGEGLGLPDREIDLYMISPDGEAIVTVATDVLSTPEVLQLISFIQM